VAYSTSKHRQKSAPKDTPPEHLSDIVRMEELLCERAPRLVNLGGGSQIFFIFTLFGEDSHFDEYLSDGLVQPLNHHPGMSSFYAKRGEVVTYSAVLLMVRPVLVSTECPEIFH